MKNRTNINFKNVKCFLTSTCAAKESQSDGLYEWMDIMIAMQFHQKKTRVNEDAKVFNCGFIDKDTGKNLLVIVDIKFIVTIHLNIHGK